MPDIREWSHIFALMQRAGKQLNGAVVPLGKLGKARLHKNSHFRESMLAQK
jgi:hypothetical protein